MIDQLVFENFGCFRGKHTLDLSGKAYGIFARLKGDDERSNWLGKSTLCRAVYFALYGEHGHRYDDDFISRGETVGGVELFFGGGDYCIRRSRARGKRTTLRFTGPEGETAIQDEAQAWIERVIGLSKEDFKATCYFEQRAMARFILTEPAARMKTISAWFRLAPLEQCEQVVRAQAAAHDETLGKIEAHFQVLEQRAQDIAGLAGWTDANSDLRTHLQEAIAAAREDLERRVGAVGALEDRLQKNAELIQNKSKIQDYEQVVAEGKRVREALEKVKLPILKEAYEKTQTELAAKLSDVETARKEARAKQALAQGQFDGSCPVAGIQCPARAEINGERERNARGLQAATTALLEKQKVLGEAQAAAGDARAEYDQGQRLDMRLTSLREQAKKLAGPAKSAAAAPDPMDPTQLRLQLDQERQGMLEVKGKLERLTGWLKEFEAADKTRETLEQKRQETNQVLGVLREAAVIFGKGGAQRRVAEGALEQIQDMANDALRDCGAKLQVEARWSREGKDIASACDACGHPFPKSAKVKTCERCGAQRGNKLENKLDIVLSDRSGAAEDLAGGFLQLAASRWLREERGTRWSMAMLDEPFGALDAAHRKGFGSHLATMLSGRYGFEQAFVVAHHSSVLDALPGRIEIVSDGGWSVPRVIA